MKVLQPRDGFHARTGPVKLFMVLVDKRKTSLYKGFPSAELEEKVFHNDKIKGCSL